MITIVVDGIETRAVLPSEGLRLAKLAIWCWLLVCSVFCIIILREFLLTGDLKNVFFLMAFAGIGLGAFSVLLLLGQHTIINLQNREILVESVFMFFRKSFKLSVGEVHEFYLHQPPGIEMDWFGGRILLADSSNKAECGEIVSDLNRLVAASRKEVRKEEMFDRTSEYYRSNAQIESWDEMWTVKQEVNTLIVDRLPKQDLLSSMVLTSMSIVFVGFAGLSWGTLRTWDEVLISVLLAALATASLVLLAVYGTRPLRRDQILFGRHEVVLKLWKHCRRKIHYYDLNRLKSTVILQDEQSQEVGQLIFAATSADPSAWLCLEAENRYLIQLQFRVASWLREQLSSFYMSERA